MALIVAALGNIVRSVPNETTLLESVVPQFGLKLSR